MEIFGIFLIAIFVGFIALIKYAEKLELKIDENWNVIVEVIEIKINKTNLIKEYLDKQIQLTTEELNEVNHTIKRLRLSTAMNLKFDFYIELNYIIVDLLRKYESYPQMKIDSTFTEIMLEYDNTDIIESVKNYNDSISKYNTYIEEPIIRTIIKIFKYKRKKEIGIDIFNNIKRTNR